MADCTEKADLTRDMEVAERKFKVACKQIVILNNQIRELKTRYQSAADKDQYRFRCAVKLRIATIEGVRNMYFEYARVKCEELEELHEQLSDSDESDMETDGYYTDSDMESDYGDDLQF